MDYQFIRGSISILRWNDDGTKTEIDRSMTDDWAAYMAWQSATGLGALTPAPTIDYIDAVCAATRQGGYVFEGTTLSTDPDSMSVISNLVTWSAQHPDFQFYVDSEEQVLTLGQASLAAAFDAIMTMSNNTMLLHKLMVADIMSPAPTLLTEKQVDVIYVQQSMTPLPGLRG